MVLPAGVVVGVVVESWLLQAVVRAAVSVRTVESKRVCCFILCGILCYLFLFCSLMRYGLRVRCRASCVCAQVMPFLRRAALWLTWVLGKWPFFFSRILMQSSAMLRAMMTSAASRALSMVGFCGQI